MDKYSQEYQQEENEEEERLWRSREEHTSSRQLQGARQLEAKNKPQR